MSMNTLETVPHISHQSENVIVDVSAKPRFNEFLQNHWSHDVPPFKRRILNYSATFISIYAAFFIQSAVLFPFEAANVVCLVVVASCLLLQVVFAGLALLRPGYWRCLNPAMGLVMITAAATVVVIDRDLTAAITDESLVNSQLPPYLPLLILGPFSPLGISVNPGLYLGFNGALLIIYFLPHLFTGNILIVCLESVCVGVFIFNSWWKADLRYKYFLNTYKLVSSPEAPARESILQLQTGLDNVLEGIKGVKSNVEQLMHTQSEDVRNFTRKVLRTLTSVHQKIAETDLYAAASDNFVQIDPEDRQFIQQNYMQQVQTSVSDPLTPSRTGEVLVKKPTEKYGYEDLVSILSQIGKTWNFNSFLLSDLTESRPIPIVGKFFLNKYNLIERFSIGETEYNNLFQEIEDNYKPNPYHNSTHAVDVLHSFNYIALHSDLSSNFTSLEILGCSLACLAHDIGHPGLTNRYLMCAKDDVALKYNDFSVLEMMHTALLFNMLRSDEMNILKKLPEADWQTLRKLIIEMILATDMSRHFELLGRFRAISEQSLDSLERFEVRLEVCKLTLKCADIGHAAKTVQLHERWTNLICEEFYNQGDIERSKGMQISMYCDRHNTDLPKVSPI